MEFLPFIPNVSSHSLSFPCLICMPQLWLSCASHIMMDRQRPRFTGLPCTTTMSLYTIHYIGGDAVWKMVQNSKNGASPDSSVVNDAPSLCLMRSTIKKSGKWQTIENARPSHTFVGNKLTTMKRCRQQWIKQRGK